MSSLVRLTEKKAQQAATRFIEKTYGDFLATSMPTSSTTSPPHTIQTLSSAVAGNMFKEKAKLVARGRDRTNEVLDLRARRFFAFGMVGFAIIAGSGIVLGSEPTALSASISRSLTSSWILIGHGIETVPNLLDLWLFFVGNLGMLLFTVLLVLSTEKNVTVRPLSRKTHHSSIPQRLFDLRLRELVNFEINLQLSRAKSPQPVPLPPDTRLRITENDSSELVATAAVETMTRLIETNDTISIGLSGRRGAGKSSTMALIKKRLGGKNLVISLSFPTATNVADLPRQILLAIVARFTSDQPMAKPGRNKIVRIGVAFLTISVASFLVLTWAHGVTIENWRTILASESASIILLYVTAIAAFFAAFFAALALAIWLANLVYYSQSRDGRMSTLAHILLDKYQRDHEHTQGVNYGIGNQSFVGGHRSRTTRRLPIQHHDIVADFRSLVATYWRTGKRPRKVIVLIDELDRLVDSTELSMILNQIRDMFHVPGSCFIISISDEARDRFVYREHGALDVMDSSFDDIVDVHPIDPDESLEMLSMRAPGFSPAERLFCHAFGGGRPREIIRSARHLLERRSAEQQKRPDYIVKEMLAKSAVTTIDHALSTEELSHRQRESLYELKLAWRQLDFDKIPTSYYATSEAITRQTEVVQRLWSAFEPALSTNGGWGVDTKGTRDSVASLATLVRAASGSVAEWEQALMAAPRAKLILGTITESTTPMASGTPQAVGTARQLFPYAPLPINPNSNLSY